MRRFIRIGPGLVIAVILAVVIGGNAVKDEFLRRKAPAGPPIVERQVISSQADELGPVPEIDFLLARREKLRLSDEQVAKLQSLQSDWKRYSAPKMEQAAEEARLLEEKLSRAQENRRTPVEQIGKDAAPVISISGQISAKRRDYWSRATSLLSQDQQKAVAAERKADYAAKLQALEEAVENR